MSGAAPVHNEIEWKRVHIETVLTLKLIFLFDGIYMTNTKQVYQSAGVPHSQKHRRNGR